MSSKNSIVDCETTIFSQVCTSRKFFLLQFLVPMKRRESEIVMNDDATVAFNKRCLKNNDLIA